MKKLTTVVSVFLLCATLFSCGGQENISESEPESSGLITPSVETGEPEPEELKLTKEDGSTDYTVIRGDDADSDEVNAAVNLKNYLNEKGLKIGIGTDWYKDKNSVSEYEIAVGSTNRAELSGFVPDAGLLGTDCYVIAAVGKKIFVSGASGRTTLEAVEKLAELWNGTGFDGLCEGSVMYFCPGADRTEFKVKGTAISEYRIYCGSETTESEKSCLDNFRGTVFSRTGKVLEYTEAKTGKYIIASVTSDAENKCSLQVSGDCISLTFTEKVGGQRFAAQLDCIFDTEEGLSDSFLYEKKYGNFLTYEEFGAKGDGKTDDFDAIIATHNNANTQGLPVYAKPGAVYYIGGADKRAVIKTDTDWTGAEFIIDDTQAANKKKEVFIIHRLEGSYAIEGIQSLKAGQTNIGVKLPADSIVSLKNSNVKRYIRYGSNANSGSDQTEVIRVDKDGNVSPDTPIIWDYDSVTSATGFKIDTETLTLRGGTITTIANQESCSGDYYYRGIKVYRSNVVIEGLEHRITGEGSDGNPYHGLVIIQSCSDVTVKDCVFCGHKTYKNKSNVSQGSYDLTVTSATDIHIINCTQSTDINDSAYWGVFASNFAKNLVFEGVEFSRFDAHQGVMNVTLRGCRFGHQGINLIGSGTALIENTTVCAKTFINLRSDYGSTWDGDIIIRNCVFLPSNGATVSSVNLIGCSNPETHDFGYTCYLPRTLTIEGLYIQDKAAGDYAGAYIFANFNSKHTSSSYNPQYPMVITEKITLSGIKTDSGKDLRICSNTWPFTGTVIENK